MDNKLINILDLISYETKLEKSLRNTLKKVDKDDLFQELQDYRLFLRDKKDFLDGYAYRLKSLQSIVLKYNRYYPSKEISTCFNDILSIRVIVSNYNIELDNGSVKHVDMTSGKKNDDGYRGYHVYYKKSNFHYPIEVQFFTERDYVFNMWLHKYVYKYKDNSVGIKLKELYDNGSINNEAEFIKEMKSCII